MDHNKLVQLLQSCQIPDTQKVKAATAELRKNYYTNPQSLLALLHIVVTHQDASLRQLAAVQALRLIPKHWRVIDKAEKPQVHAEIVKAAVREENAKCRHSESRVIAGLAAIDLEDGEWKDLLPQVLQLTTANDVKQREVGSYLIFSLLEADPLLFKDYVPQLFELFSKTIRDPESLDVRVNTILSISAILMLIEADEDEDALNALQNLVPPMVDVLKAAVDAGDDEKIKQAFEVFQSFLAYESALLSKYFKDLVQFMVDLAANTQADDEVRTQALAFLSQTVKYRRMKIQAIPDMGAQLVKKSLHILTEADEDEDDDDELTPARTALALIDCCSNELPPRQVIVPLLDDFPKLAGHQDPSFRRAGVLALGTAAEGSPDFLATQLKSIMPTLLQLLNDGDASVRADALLCLTRIAEEMASELAPYHQEIMTALVNNFDAAVSDESKKSVDIVRRVCSVVDAMVEGFESEVMIKYAPELIQRFGRLLNHSSHELKAGGANALGAIAASIEGEFKPYFEVTMKALEPFVTIKDNDEDLALRSGVCDAMGRIASAVGPELFQPYVKPLMQASEEALHLGHNRLRETSFILWSQLAKVYGGDLAPFLEGIITGLCSSLELEEEALELDLDEEQDGLVDSEIVAGSKKIKFKKAGDAEDEDEMEDEDEADWDDIIGVSDQALEKEIAVEVLGDVIHHAKGNAVPYIEKVLELVTPMIEHTYEGCRKAAISTMWRIYDVVWKLMEERTGSKWEPGLPLKQTPPQELLKLGEAATTATLLLWSEEAERDVVIEINRNVAAALRACGPAILTQKEMMQQTISVLGMLITRSHPSQQDLGDEDEDQEVQGSSEYDWMIVDTATDVIIGLAAALGDNFGEVWKVFEKPMMKFASSNEAVERATAVGVIAECTSFMGSAVTPYTANLLRLLVHRLSDEDKETKSNAAYAVGQLLLNSQDSATYLPSYGTILTKLEPLLQTPESRMLDNAAGCVSRMIMAHPDKVPIGNVLPALVGLLPLKEDYDENKPVYKCIYTLYEQSNPTVQELTPKLIPIFEQVLGPPQEQLDDETRVILRNTVGILHNAKPDLFSQHQECLKRAGIA